MITLKVGPQEEVLEFIVDTGAERTCVMNIPKGCDVSNDMVKVTGAKGEGFKVPVIKDVVIEGETKIGIGDVLLVPGAGSNLLGRDLQIQLGIGVIPEEGRMTAKVLKLSQEDERKINREVWAGEGNRGGLDIDPIRVTIEKEECPIRVRQYPISLEGRKGLKPVIEELIKDRTLEPCKSPHNTPILPVKKSDGNYRLVQDLREVNKRTRACYRMVPNPYTLLSEIPPQRQWFSVVDLKDAFWACPLAEESQNIFAFEWEDPNTGKKNQLKWTKLPQGYCEAPYLFGQALGEILQTFPTPSGIQIIQYVDDLLISGEDEIKVKETTIKLLNFLGEKGLRASKRKLQFVESEVKYLGHLISKGSRKLNPERITGILSLPPPSSKKEVRRLLGLLGYCRLWIEGYTQAVKFLYEKLTGGDNIQWTKDDDNKLEKLKLKLASVPALSLPSLAKPFHLYVNAENGVAHGVLVQEWGGVRRPIAYLSKLLDPVSRGWPLCIQAIAATAILVEESRKLTSGRKLIVYTPHAVRNVLKQKAEKWLTDSRILKYKAILIDSNDLTIETSKSLNPAQFLYGEPKEDLAHDCLEMIQYQTKVREDLEEQALLEGKRIHVDGSSRCLQGKRMSRYALVDGINMQTIEKGKPPSNWSAQSCQLYALKRALEHLAHKKGTIYTDSKYAFRVIHTFGKIWEERCLLNSKGKELIHEGLISEVLEALKLPKEIAVVHIKGHQKGMTPEIRGSNLADQEAKDAAENGTKRIMLILTPERGELEIPKFSKEEEKELFKIGGEQDQSGKWKLPDGRQLLNKPLTRRILEDMHQKTPWGTQALCDHFLRNYGCLGIFGVAKQITGNRITCQRVNKKIMRKTTLGGRELALRPFQSIQVDFTELPQVQRWKFLLVIVDHLTHWVEAVPATRATANVACKTLLQQIIPRYGMVNKLDSDRGTHFSSKVLQQITQALGIKWELHTPWHPQSSGRVERMNQTLKKTLTKLMIETQLSWAKCLPLALLRVRTQPRSDLGVSPYEMMFGLPFLTTQHETATYEVGEASVRKYVTTIARTLENLRLKRRIPQTTTLEFKIHNIHPGEWVLVKTWKEQSLTPQWEGPFQVLLTTEAAVRTKERGWIHASRIKGPVKEPEEWTVISKPGDTKLILKWRPGGNELEQSK